MAEIRVLIVDDSALIRRLYRDMLNADPDITVVGEAADPYEARELIKSLNPDVVTLDIEMPKMDGLSFLQKIMTLRPMPVVMSSTLTQKGAETTLRAMELGAVEVVAKPLEGKHAVIALQEELCHKVKVAAKARVKPLQCGRAEGPSIPVSGEPRDIIIAIGASTGGVEALSRLLGLLPPQMPPVLITQHMPPHFTANFARRLDQHAALSVKEASNGERIAVGHAYIAPGGRHMELGFSGIKHGYTIKLSDGAAISGHKPSVDMLFHSVAQKAGRQAIGLILTGMGKDGAKGLLAMREAGARTLGQNEGSCVVYGMPRAARMVGAVEQELSLDLLAKTLVELALR